MECPSWVAAEAEVGHGRRLVPEPEERLDLGATPAGARPEQRLVQQARQAQTGPMILAAQAGEEERAVAAEEGRVATEGFPAAVVGVVARRYLAQVAPAVMAVAV